jgi:hypothetical protein
LPKEIDVTCCDVKTISLFSTWLVERDISRSVSLGEPDELRENP